MEPLCLQWPQLLSSPTAVEHFLQLLIQFIGEVSNSSFEMNRRGSNFEVHEHSQRPTIEIEVKV